MSESLIALTEGSGKNLSTQTMTINGSTVHIERSTMGMGVVTLPGTPQINAVSSTGLVPASAVDVQGRYYIVCKNTFNDASAYAIYRFAFYDSNSSLIGYSDLIAISNTGILLSARYCGSPVVYGNDFAAKEIKIYLYYISDGDDISIYVGAV